MSALTAAAVDQGSSAALTDTSWLILPQHVLTGIVTVWAAMSSAADAGFVTAEIRVVDC